MRRWYVLILVIVLAACGETSDRDAPDGEELFRSTVLGGQAGCITCHSLEPDRVLVGPSLAAVGTRADDRVVGMTAADYLRQSIVDPDAHVVEGFDAGRMPSVWGEVLSQSEIDALVAYLEGMR